MKLYDSAQAPNPRRVRIFLAEKGVSVPRVPVDIMELEHKGEAFARINPRRRIPALELDDGTVITESIAICRYFEALYPEPPLFGTGALGQAIVEMWQRRMEFEFLGPVAAVFRHTRRSMARMEVPQLPEWAEVNRPRVYDFLRFLDGHLETHPFVTGEHFSVADITGFVGMEILSWGKLEVPPDHHNVRRWHAALAARPSASA